MSYEEIEIEGMKEILKDKEEEIVKLRARCNALESENKLYKEELKARLNKIAELEEENRNLRKNNPKLYEKTKNYIAFEDNGVSPSPNGKWEC